MKRATFLAVYLFVVVLDSQAQDRALISGDVSDKQDTPIPGVQVTLRNESLRVERVTSTNADGLYFFAEVVPAEGYVTEASAPGMSFAPHGVRFEVQVGETRHLLPSFIGEKVASPTASSQALTLPSLVIRLCRLQAQHAIALLSISWIDHSEVVPRTVSSADHRSSASR